MKMKTRLLIEVEEEIRTFKWAEEGGGKNYQYEGRKRGRKKSFDQSEEEGKEQCL